jgi:hypothetical protein
LKPRKTVVVAASNRSATAEGQQAMRFQNRILIAAPLKNNLVAVKTTPSRDHARDVRGGNRAIKRAAV